MMRFLLTRKYAIAISEQALASITAFAIGVLVARHYAAEVYALYVLTIVLSNHGAGVVRNLLTTPSIVLAGASPARLLRRLWARAALLVGLLALGSAAAVVALVLLAPAGFGFESALGIVAYFIGWVLRECVRGHLVQLALPHVALGITFAASISLTLLLAICASTAVDVGIMMLLVGVGNATSYGGAALYWLRRSTPTSMMRIGVTVRRHWALGRWLLVRSSVNIGLGIAVPVLLLVTEGGASVAAFGAALQLANLANPLIMAIIGVARGEIARRIRTSLGSALRASRRILLISLLGGVIVVPIVAACSQQVMAVVYGSDYGSESFMLAYTVANLAVMIGGVAGSAVLEAQGRVRRVANSSMFGGATFIAGLGGSHLLRIQSAHGILASLVLANLVTASLNNARARAAR